MSLVLFTGSRSPPIRSTSLGDMSPARGPCFPKSESDTTARVPPLTPGPAVLSIPADPEGVGAGGPGGPQETPATPEDSSPPDLPSCPSEASDPRPPAASTAPQTYVAQCDSIESLGMEENSALLRDEEKSKSENSLLIFFDGTDVQDTCV